MRVIRIVPVATALLATPSACGGEDKVDPDSASALTRSWIGYHYCLETDDAHLTVQGGDSGAPATQPEVKSGQRK